MGGSFSIESIPSLEGKNVIVTGASSGIGEFVAGVLAQRGAKVIMACRSEEKTQHSISKLKEQHGDTLDLTFMELNLASLKSVESFAEAFLQLDLPLHILVQNAGVMAPPLGYSEDNIELQFATNHLGHFLLSQRLLPALERAGTTENPARIVATSSLAHKWAPGGDGIIWDHLKVGAACEGYKPWSAYGQSKLCNILFAKAFAARLKQAQKPVVVNAIHPGYVATDLQRNMYDLYGYAGSVMGWVGYRFAKTVEQGSMSTLYAATSPEVIELGYSGAYFVPPGKLGKETDQAKNMDVAEKLWQVSEDLVKEILKE